MYKVPDITGLLTLIILRDNDYESVSKLKNVGTQPFLNSEHGFMKIHELLVLRICGNYHIFLETY